MALASGVIKGMDKGKLPGKPISLWLDTTPEPTFRQ
jgi:hypothetical protein